jgi:cyclohexadieny/prephenate dehydrogenase
VTEKLGAPLAQPIFERIAIVGVGLIGSSIARAARRTRAAGIIAIADVSPTVRARRRVEARRSHRRLGGRGREGR